jgi:hypothetical protein
MRDHPLFFLVEMRGVCAVLQRTTFAETGTGHCQELAGDAGSHTTQTEDVSLSSV